MLEEKKAKKGPTIDLKKDKKLPSTNHHVAANLWWRISATMGKKRLITPLQLRAALTSNYWSGT